MHSRLRLYIFGIIVFFNLNTIYSQLAEGNFVVDGQPAPQIHIKHAVDEIFLDGQLDEISWQNSTTSSNFTQYFPTDSIRANGETELYFTYDDEHIYLAAKCYTAGNEFLVESLKRDYGFGSNDNISFMLDTYNDKTNAFLFGMNPYGVRREALISNGGKNRNAFDASWDNKWDGASKTYDNYWICELKIPFKSIRYAKGNGTWRFNAYRNDAQCGEISCFINIPREYILMDLQYTAELVWEEPLTKPAKNLSVIPFVAGGILRDFENVDETKAQTNFDFGGDAKIGIGSSMNLDLTVNPDFSQVEVDRQVTNLDRFEIFFPERRQFFLENADLFNSFGDRRANPFFSRRIGISVDTTTGNNIQNRIYGGARLTGKINEDLRVGLISMQTAPQPENDLPSFNYTVFAAEQVVQERSNIAAIVVNKQAINPDNFGETVDNYDRVAGLEYRMRSKDNFWTGKVSYLKALTPNEKEHKFSHLASIEYNRDKIRLRWEHLFVGDGFDAEVGFVPRRDVFVMRPQASYRLFPENEKVAQQTFTLSSNIFYKLGKDDNLILPDAGIEQTEYNANWDISYANTARFNVSVGTQRFTLLDDFDPTRVQDDGVFIAAGQTVNNYGLSASYNSDRRKKFTYRIGPEIQSFYDGLRLSMGGRFSYRIQPYGSIGVNYNYNYIELGGNFETANLFLIGPRIDLTFTKKLFWTTFIQYNNQSDNLNFNSRLQWRFAKVSDVFLVYTDNYNTETFSPLASRNRALVAKVTYWLNL
jgi:hypothetical protein